MPLSLKATAEIPEAGAAVGLMPCCASLLNYSLCGHNQNFSVSPLKRMNQDVEESDSFFFLHTGTITSCVTDATVGDDVCDRCTSSRSVRRGPRCRSTGFYQNSRKSCCRCCGGSGNGNTMQLSRRENEPNSF